MNLGMATDQPPPSQDEYEPSHSLLCFKIPSMSKLEAFSGSGFSSSKGVFGLGTGFFHVQVPH